ncbi:MAG: ArsA-related P-loop ATPase [Acidimicrobiales bacterium]
MDAAAFCRQSSVVLVAGKGGVGKTTIAAALALTARRQGMDVLVVELEGRSGAAALLGHPGALAYEEVTVLPGSGSAGEIRARALAPDEVLVEYLENRGLGKVSRRLAGSGALDVVATAVPGLRDVLVLGKVKQLEGARLADLIVLDAPAAGHTLTFLTSAAGLADFARSGPVRSQAADVLEMLHDPARCQVLLVTLAEETPVNETTEAAYALEDRAGVALGPVVVNALYPTLPGRDGERAPSLEAYLAGPGGGALGAGEREALLAADRFRRMRAELQRRQRERLAASLPLHQLPLPYLFGATAGEAALVPLAEALEEGLAKLPAPPPAPGRAS